MGIKKRGFGAPQPTSHNEGLVFVSPRRRLDQTWSRLWGWGEGVLAACHECGRSLALQKDCLFFISCFFFVVVSISTFLALIPSRTFIDYSES